ncbi:MAG: hypothetical protein QOD62_2595 [Actinomycetota bacterium]|nr:hypothetical protein [Actinomycetota bacterium]
MTNPGAHSEDMRDRRSLKDLRDEDIDRLLSGKAAGSEGAGDLAAFVQGVQATYVALPAEDAARRHIAAAAAAARQAATTGADLAGSPTAFISRWRRRTVLGMSVATMTLSLGAAAIAATAATGGLAARGDLPGPIQRAVAQAASGVGISLPSGGSGSGSPGSSASHAVPPVGTGSSKTKASATAAPSASATPGRGSHGGSPLPGGARRSDDSSAGIPDGVAATSANHGTCVAYAEQIAGTLGLGDSERSTFVSLVARDQTAVTVPVARDAKPDAACQSSIDSARASAAAHTGNPGGVDDHSTPGSGHGKDASPAPTATPTPTATASSPTPTPSPSDHSPHGGKGN